MNKVRNIHQGRDNWAEIEAEPQKKENQQEDEKGVELELDFGQQL